jgi:cholesterol oxidase
MTALPPEALLPEMFEAAVIGSGFGGAISACRLAKRWPGGVVVLERGKRYPMGSFPRTPHAFARNFWNLPRERRKRRGALAKQELHGLFDLRHYKGMDAVLCAGLGGGSLIYANVFMEPPEQVFDNRWPATVKKSQLAPYYRVAKEVLGARPIPRNQDPRRQIVRTALFEQVASEIGKRSELVDINVFFGNDFNNPLEIGHQQTNRYGAVQTSCVYCAECDVGCNTHSKNTLDLNYLYAAEHRHAAKIWTEHLVTKIVPVDASGNDAPGTDGSHGYRIFYEDLRPDGRGLSTILARRVVISAGTLGSTELLFQCRDVYRTLPRVSSRLGQRFSGNGDFLSFVIDGDREANPNYGPVITQRIDFELFSNPTPGRSFILEDASYPVFTAWFTEGIKPGFLHLGPLWRALTQLLGMVTGWTTGTMGVALSSLLSRDLSQNTAVLLCMGLDKSNGVISLDRNGRVDVTWSVSDNRSLYDGIVAAGKQFRDRTGGRFVELPTWWWPLRQSVTVHALGGCALGSDASTGVTSADPKTLGQVFGYTGLYVIDGALLPTAVGANPTATISAVAEMAAEGITSVKPDANL